MANDVPGIRTVVIKKPGEKNPVPILHIDLKKAFEENPKRPPVKLGRLAAVIFWLNPIDVFDAITKNNDKAARSLFKIALGKDAPATMDGDAHAALRLEAVKLVNGRTDPKCVDFELRGDEIGELVLPENPAFEKFLKAPELDGKRARLVRFKVIQPDLDKLTGVNGELVDIRTKAQQLRGALDDLTTHVGPRSKTLSPHASLSEDAGAIGDVGVLWMLEGMLGAIVNNPKDPKKRGSSDEAKLDGLRTNVTDLREKATRHLVLRPLTGRAILDNLKAKADALKAAVEADSFVQHIDTVVANQDLLMADPVWMDVADTLVAAVTALAGTDHAPEILDNHIEPLIQQLASENKRSFDNVVMNNKPLFLKALKERVDKPQVNRPSAILRYGSAPATVIGALVGNTAGPSSVALAGQQAYMSYIIKKHFKICVKNGSFDFQASQTAKTFKAYDNLVNRVHGLSTQEFAAFTEAMDKNDFKVFYKFAWAKKSMAGWHWGAFLGLLSMLALVTSVMQADISNPDAILSTIANVGGSLTSSFVDLAQVFKSAPEIGKAFGNFAKFFNKELRIFEFGKNLAAKAGLAGAEVTVADLVGAVGGVFMMLAGYLSYKEAQSNNDETGMWIGAATVAAGALSVFGFLCALGFLGLTGIGAPLMVVGAALAAIVALVQVTRDLLTPGSLLVFKAYLDYFNRDARASNTPGVTLPPSTFKIAVGDASADAAKRDELQKAFDLVQGLSQPKVPPFNIFYAADKKVSVQLFQLGFDVDQISKICDEDFITISEIIDKDNDLKLLGVLNGFVNKKGSEEILRGGSVTIVSEDGKNMTHQMKVGEGTVIPFNRFFVKLPQNSYRIRVDIDGLKGAVAGVGIIAQQSKDVTIEVE